ncbi:MAG: hypothetical protein ACPGXZ_17075, partial [Saprospiraceae bacterium]
KDTKGNFGDLQLKGIAKIAHGKLRVGVNSYAIATPYSGPQLKEKTLVAWARIDNAAIRGGSILSVGRTANDFDFDGIVYAERQPRTWMAGSGFFRRTRDIGNLAKEMTPRYFVKMAISYGNDNGKAAIKVYRNNILVGEYTQNSPLIDFSGQNIGIFLGARHLMAGGKVPSNGFVEATIEEVRVYNGVLDATAIKRLTLEKKVASSNTLNIGQELKTGEKLISKNGVFYLKMQSDGNLCLKKVEKNQFVWCSMEHGFSGATLKMQTDGHLVVYNGNNQAKWMSKTHPSFDKRFNAPNKPVKLVLEDDGSLRLHNASGNAVWSNKDGVIISKNDNKTPPVVPTVPTPPVVPTVSTASTAKLDAFFNQYGGKDKFSKHYIDALTTMITVEDLVKVNKYKQAKTELDRLWKAYPVGTDIWKNSNADDRKYKTNIGNPAAYNALRMLTDIVKHNLKSPNPSGEVLTATLRVVLVDCSEGQQPKTIAEMQNGTGRNGKIKLDSRLKANNHRIIDQSLNIFKRYVNAMTDGRLKVEVKYYDLNYCVPTRVSKDGKKANFKNNDDVINQIPKNIHDESDWFWILYPSVVPEDGVNGVAANAGFDKNQGGMNTGGMDTRGQKPFFIVNDKWLLRVPPHMGKGEISDIERRAYLPQWLQHEFFHHLYNIYPELLLEQKYKNGKVVKDSHKWFDRSKWPSNFTGSHEADYYQESLHKRFKTATPSLQYMLKPTYKPSQKLLNSLTINQFLNKTFDASEAIRKQGSTPNGWHVGQIIQENGKYYWKNKANKKWEIQPDLKNGVFKNLSEVRYKGEDFFIMFKKDKKGRFINQIEGLIFKGGLYKLK